MSRIFLLITGWFATGLAILGVLLPLVPATPFLLVAGYCFGKSSPKWHAKLQNAPLFGPYLTQWEQTHTVPRSAKNKAWVMTLLSFGVSAALVPIAWVRWMLIGIAMLVCLVIWRLPVGEAPGRAAPSD